MNHEEYNPAIEAIDIFCFEIVSDCMITFTIIYVYLGKWSRPHCSPSLESWLIWEIIPKCPDLFIDNNIYSLTIKTIHLTMDIDLYGYRWMSWSTGQPISRRSWMLAWKRWAGPDRRRTFFFRNAAEARACDRDFTGTSKNPINMLV